MTAKPSADAQSDASGPNALPSCAWTSRRERHQKQKQHNATRNYEIGE